jgi:hypothetical protein
LKFEFTGANLADVLTFAKVFGNGPDFLCCFSLNLALVYLLWRPFTCFLDDIVGAEHFIATGEPHCGSISFTTQQRRDLIALAVALSPVLFTFFAIPDCTGNKRWVQWLLVCGKRDIDTPSFPVLPYLVDFSLGILAAACWSRFLSDLRPVGNGGPNGGSSILPMSDLRRWWFALHRTALVLLVFFVPLGQVWLYTDLSVVQMATPVGQLIRGFSNGPSMLWLLATLWPVAMWTATIAVLVILKGTALGLVLQWPLRGLEHLGANTLYYLVVGDVFLAGMFRGLLKDTGAAAFPIQKCLICTGLILGFGRFLHLLCKTSRK